MFHFFRRKDRLVRWFLSGLLLLVCLTMVAYLIPGFTGLSATDDATVLAKVAGDSITSLQVQRHLQQFARNNHLATSMFPFFAARILDQIVDEKTGEYEARRMGLEVTLNEVADSLRANTNIFPNGQFIGEDRYRDLIEQGAGMSVPQFEEAQRGGLLIDKLRRVITDGITLSDADLEQEYRRTKDKIKVDYVFLKPADYVSQVLVTESDLKVFFQKTRSNYQIPQKRRMKYLFLDQEKVRESVDAQESEIRQFYERNKDRFRVPDRAQASHILLKTTELSPDQIKENEKKIGELLKKARAGEDFAALAKQNSQDEASAPKGGELGWVTHGQMVAEFEKAVFSLEPGKISDVVKTQYGFHIVKVTARERAHQQTLEEVSAQILPMVKQEKGERAAQMATDRVEAALRHNPKSMDAVAAELNLAAIEIPAHARGDAFPNLGPSGPVDEAAFSLKAGELSGVVSAGKGLAVLLVEQAFPPRPSELGEVRDRVERDYRAEKGSEIMKTRSNELAARARALSDLKKAAAEMKLAVKTSEALTREDRIAEVGTVMSERFPTAAFEMKPGEIAGPLIAANGNFVFVLSEQLFASPEEVAKNRDSLRSKMLEEKRNSVYSMYLEDLKERLKKEGKLTINEAALKRFTGSLEP